MSTPPIQAVLFDLDGTLIDSAADLALAVNKMRAARQLPALSLESYRPHVGSGARGLLPIGLGVQHGDADFAALREEFFDTYESCLGAATQTFDEINAVLAQLNESGMPWGIVTNKIERFALPITRTLQSLAGWRTVVAGDTTAHAKPHPEPLLAAARDLKIDPSACIYVGDDRRDMLAGKAAGMRTVAALYGYIAPDEATDEWPADWRVNTPSELTRIWGIG